MSEEKQELETVEAQPISRAPEIDTQIATAKRYKRSMKTVMAEVKTQVGTNIKTAEEMAYRLKRGKKTIVGPTVRMAEIFASAWGNLRAETRVLGADATHVSAEAMCWDLEKNVAIRCEVKRRITDSKGNRYNQDMITVTGMAASSIALRNSIFRVIPKSYVNEALEEAKSVVVGDEKTMTEKRADAFGAFKKYGISAERILAVIGRPSIEDVDIDNYLDLRGYYNSIKQEGIDPATIFPVIETAEEKEAKATLKEKLTTPPLKPVPEKYSNEDGTPKKPEDVVHDETPDPEPDPEPEPEPVQESLITEPDAAKIDKAAEDDVKKANKIDLYYSLVDQTDERPKKVTKLSVEEIEKECDRLKEVIEEQ